MTDSSDQQKEQMHTPEGPGTERSASNGQADFEELKEATQHFFTTLVRVGMHLATTPVSQLPEESQNHFKNAAREFTQGFSTLAHELSTTMENVFEEVKPDERQDA